MHCPKCSNDHEHEYGARCNFGYEGVVARDLPNANPKRYLEHVIEQSIEDRSILRPESCEPGT